MGLAKTRRNRDPVGDDVTGREDRQRIVGIIQARLGSSRLPAKVLREIDGVPMLKRVVDRARHARELKSVLVATTDQEEDDRLVQACRSWEVPFFRGSEEDVLDRVYRAAREAEADIVVRLTGDCPFIDAAVIDRVVRVFRRGSFDYVSNVDPPTYPDGLDTEVMSLKALKEAWEKASWQSEREHVTPYIRKHEEQFRTQNVSTDPDLSHLRWTVDEEEDLEFVRALYRELGDPMAGFREVWELVRARPKLSEINAGLERNEGLRRSLLEDQRVGNEGPPRDYGRGTPDE